MDLHMEFFYDSHATDKWTVIVYANDDAQFTLTGDTWDGIMEDLTYKTKFELDEVLSVTW
jgi:hypothetical protein